MTGLPTKNEIQSKTNTSQPLGGSNTDNKPAASHLSIQSLTSNSDVEILNAHPGQAFSSSEQKPRTAPVKTTFMLTAYLNTAVGNRKTFPKLLLKK